MSIAALSSPSRCEPRSSVCSAARWARSATRTSPSSPSVQVTSVTAAPSATYLAMVAPLPIVSSSGCACTTMSRRSGSSLGLGQSHGPTLCGMSPTARSLARCSRPPPSRFSAQSHIRAAGSTGEFDDWRRQQQFKPAFDRQTGFSSRLSDRHQRITATGRPVRQPAVRRPGRLGRYPGGFYDLPQPRPAGRTVRGVGDSPGGRAGRGRQLADGSQALARVSTSLRAA